MSFNYTRPGRPLHKTMRGVTKNMEEMRMQNENVTAVTGRGSMARMNARGDSLAKGGRIDKTREAIESEYNQNPMGNVKNVSLKEIMPDVFETPAEVMARLQAQSQAAASALTPDAPANVVGRRGARKLVDKAD